MNSIPKYPMRYQVGGKRGHQLQLFIERLFIESGFTNRR